MPSLGVSSLDLTALLSAVLFWAIRKFWQEKRLFGRKRQAFAAASDFRRKIFEKKLQRIDDAAEVRLLFQRRLVDVERAVDLDLQRVQVAPRPSIMLRDEAAGI